MRALQVDRLQRRIEAPVAAAETGEDRPGGARHRCKGLTPPNGISFVMLVPTQPSTP